MNKKKTIKERALAQILKASEPLIGAMAKAMAPKNIDVTIDGDINIKEKADRLPSKDGSLSSTKEVSVSFDKLSLNFAITY